MASRIPGVGREPPPYRVSEYRLSLDVDYDSLDFSGVVSIDVEEPQGSVFLNSVDLTIDRLRVGGEDRTPRFEQGEEGFEIEGVSGPSQTIEVEFRGHVAEHGLTGLYRSGFGGYDLLTTQCAPTGARRIFPCVDRPDRKAPMTFDLTVDVDDEAIFNTPVVEQRTKGSRKRLTFLPTPPMATYLFYLGIGPFELLRGRADRVRLSIATPIDRSSAGQFALDHASRILPALEEYFADTFPLPKLDLIAVPDFGAGAMENWGAVTFREMALLVDRTVSARLRRRIRTVIAHEFAHQWFGDLVTMAWWNDIWLNESFATFMEPTILDPLYPEAEAWTEFVLNWTAPALFDDSLPTAHPVQADVERPDEIAQVFDHISYGKGSAVLRMFSESLGPETVRAGVREYLKRFRYANARSEDLWDAIEQAAGQPVVPMLRQWIGRPGIPVVRARREGGRLELTQERFVLGNPPPPESPWPIPLTLKLDGKSQTHLFSDPKLELPIEGARTVLLNPQGAGFYRVHYDEGLYDGLLHGWNDLGGLDQWSVLQDLYAFLLAGDVTIDRYVQFVDGVADRASRAGLFELVREYVGPFNQLEPPNLGFLIPSHPGYQAAVSRLLGQLFERLGATAREGESEGDQLLRGSVTHALAWSGGDRAAELAALFANYDDLDPDLRRGVAVAYAQAGGELEHAGLIERLARTQDEGSAFILEIALMAFRTPETIARTLEMFSGDQLRRAHVPALLGVLARNFEARDATWKWLTEHGEAFAAKFPTSGFGGDMLGETIPYLGIGREADVERFLREHPWPESERGALRAFAMLQVTGNLVRRVAGS